MKDVRRFGNNELFGIKARDDYVRTGFKVAVLGAFVPNGSVRPGFRVNMMSTEGVSGTAQVIRFARREDAENWLNTQGTDHYSTDELSIMNNRAGEFIRLPLCNYPVDAWVNSVILERFSDRVLSNLYHYCPQYIDDTTPNIEPGHPNIEHYHYRGFRF